VRGQWTHPLVKNDSSSAILIAADLISPSLIMLQAFFQFLSFVRKPLNCVARIRNQLQSVEDGVFFARGGPGCRAMQQPLLSPIDLMSKVFVVTADSVK
jgi:hypothetical protein